MSVFVFVLFWLFTSRPEGRICIGPVPCPPCVEPAASIPVSCRVGNPSPVLLDSPQPRRFEMPALDWSQCPAVESVPGKVSGAWVFRGTRMPVATVFENLMAGANIEEIMEWFDVSKEQIAPVLSFVARSLEA